MTDRRICEVCVFAAENGWWGQQGTHCMTCHRSWAGRRECHCMSCHRHFSTPTLFDAHLGMVRGEMACKDPKGGVRSEGGIWMYPGPGDRAAEWRPRVDPVTL